MKYLYLIFFFMPQLLWAKNPKIDSLFAAIADVLNLSYHTLTNYTKNIRRKMDVHSNLDVVAIAFKNK